MTAPNDELSRYGAVFQWLAAEKSLAPGTAAANMGGGMDDSDLAKPAAVGGEPPLPPDAIPVGYPDAPSSLASDDAAIKAKAEAEAGASPLKGATPEQLLAALRGLGGQHVIGMTRGGFQPSGRGQQTQTEEKVLPPEWYNTLRQLEMHGKAGAEGMAAGEAELSRIQANAAKSRAVSLGMQAQAETKTLEQEERARDYAQQRIDRAMAEYQASGPRFENYGSLFNASTPTQQAAGLGGMLLGLFGGAMTGQQSGFTKALDGMIERRAQLAEADSRKKGQLVGMAENAYSRLERSFADSRAARAALRAIYAEQAKAALEGEAAQLGIGMEHPKLQEALARLDAQKLGYLRDTAAVVTENARAEEKYVPPQAIVAPGGGGLEAGESKKEIEEDQKFAGQLAELKIPDRLSALDMMAEASNEIGKDTAFWANVAASNPGTLGKLYSLYGADPARQKYLSAYNLYLANLSGKTVSKEEAPRLAAMLGSGDEKARRAALDVLNRPVQEDIDTLRAGGWDAPAKRYLLKREYNQRLGRSGWDRVGVDKPLPQTEPVPVQ